MKRGLFTLLAILLVICMCGCDETSDSAVTFYYLRKDTDFGSETPLLVEFNCQTSDLQDFESIIKQYLAGPESNDLMSPFPEETKIQSFEITSSHLTVTLSCNIESLTASRQTLAFACMTKTLIALTGVNSVQLIIDDVNYAEQNVFNFSNDSFVYLDSISYSDLEIQ